MDEPRGALMLLFATPAMAGMAYANITGTYDNFATFCFYLSCTFYMLSGVLAYQVTSHLVYISLVIAPTVLFATSGLLHAEQVGHDLLGLALPACGF